MNRPAATKAPLQPIITGRAWERVQIDLIDMRHEPSGQFKWILHIKDHFSKYTQLYPLKSMHAEPIAAAFDMFITAFCQGNTSVIRPTAPWRHVYNLILSHPPLPSL